MSFEKVLHLFPWMGALVMGINMDRDSSLSITVYVDGYFINIVKINE